jgi:hypothetical protein
MMNVDALVGYSVKGQITKSFFWFADGGISLNADVANWNIPIINIDYQLASIAFGLGIGGGLQFNLPVPGLFVQAGVGFSFDFFHQDTVTISYNDTADTKKEYGGNFGPANLISLTAPYIAVGYRF